MCGITVLLSPQMNSRQLMRMTQAIRHRGPDDEGYVFFSDTDTRCLGGVDTPAEAYTSATPYQPSGAIEKVALPSTPVLGFGHRRLSIIDLSPLGHQPMCDASSRYWITYNGEIYNHVELRTELEALGHRFASHSDTEVVLAAYRQWGEDCLSRFNGMWAFAIHDRDENKLFIARDRFGIKPLYYWASPNGELAFSSEIKQFTEMAGWRAVLNPQRAYDFLAWSIMDHTEETLFDRVYQLNPGSAITLQVDTYASAIGTDGRLPAKKWYQLSAREFSGSFEDATVELKQRLTDAVALHLRADVPIGSCLSGGLDSSSIVCLMNQLLAEQKSSALQKTFSACANVKRFDERVWIDQVVDATGVEAHYVYPDIEHLFENVAQIIWHQDEPFGSTSIYAQWQVFESAAHNNVKVMLDGQGADEQLAGYHGFFAPRLGDLFKRGQWLTLISEMRAMKKLHGYSFLTGCKYIASSLLPEAARDFLRRKAGMTNASPAWLNVERLKCTPKNPFFSAGAVGIDSIQKLSIAQLTASNLQMLLHWEDRDSMAHSIESRVPFLDYRLVEFALGLPDAFKLSDGVTKRILRSAMSGILPSSIRDRMDKLGFVTPEEIWLRERAPGVFRKKLQTAIERSQGIINNNALTIFDEIVAGKRAFNFTTWRIICFGEWLDRFDVSPTP